MSEPTTAVRPGHGQEHLRTTCGREVTVGRLDLGDVRHPARRVFLDLGACPGCAAPGCAAPGWAGLTVAEARELAGALLAEAATAEREAGPGAAGAGRIAARHISGDAYEITVRGHTMLVDQPARDGGHDAGPTPTELLVASLASCVAFYAGRYLLRHGLDRSGLTVHAGFTMAEDRPARVGGVWLRISVPGGIPAQRRAALLAVASHCTVHNTLRQEPGVSIELGS